MIGSSLGDRWCSVVRKPREGMTSKILSKVQIFLKTSFLLEAL